MSALSGIHLTFETLSLSPRVQLLGEVGWPASSTSGPPVSTSPVLELQAYIWLFKDVDFGDQI